MDNKNNIFMGNPRCFLGSGGFLVFWGILLDGFSGIQDELLNQGEGIVREAGKGTDEAVACSGITGDSTTQDGGHSILQGLPAGHLPHPGTEPDLIHAEDTADVCYRPVAGFAFSILYHPDKVLG